MSELRPDLAAIKGLAEALAFIRSRYKVAAIYVFGSRARGDAKGDSDLDLCILIDDESVRPIEAIQDLGLELHRLVPLSLDILVFQKARFFERRDAGASFERTITREGIAV